MMVVGKKESVFLNSRPSPLQARFLNHRNLRNPLVESEVLAPAS